MRPRRSSGSDRAAGATARMTCMRSRSPSSTGYSPPSSTPRRCSRRSWPSPRSIEEVRSMPRPPQRSKNPERAARTASRAPTRPLVARMWHGVVPTERADAYTAYLRRTGVKDCRATPGNRGVHVLRRTVGGTTHFLFISFWASLDAIRGFAGEDIERARYYPGPDLPARARAHGHPPRSRGGIALTRWCRAPGSAVAYDGPGAWTVFALR